VPLSEGGPSRARPSRTARFLRHRDPVHPSGRRSSSSKEQTDKPTWVDALEESLLLAISLFALITWIVLIAVLSH
jgi:hypothetical protein